MTEDKLTNGLWNEAGELYSGFKEGEQSELWKRLGRRGFEDPIVEIVFILAALVEIVTERRK